MTDEIANLTKCEAVRLRLLDEPDAIDCGAVVLAKPACRPTRPRKEGLTLVVPERIASETACSGELPNS